MATITVNTTVDEQDGSIFDGDVSLRDALAIATAGDTIEFSSAAFFVDSTSLDNTAIALTLGELAITSDVTINGDINGDGIADVTLDGQNNNRIFNVTGAGTDFRLNGMTLTGGYVDLSAGGAIIADAPTNVVITNSNLTGNFASTGGGAIMSLGDLTIVNSYLGGNTTFGNGGAIEGADATIVNSTFTQNAADSGGAIAGAIGGATFDIVNSTLTGNFADYSGGGTYSGTFYVSNSIIFGNAAAVLEDDVGVGTLASNSSNIFGAGVVGPPGDQYLSIFDLPNVFENVGAVTVGGETFDAGLVSLTEGVTPVIGITQGGFAQDGGDNADMLSEADLGFDVDGDGTIETGPLDRDASGNNRIVDGIIDIGASENFDRTWVVDTTTDIDDGDLTTGNLSLREAVNNAVDGDLIIFDSAVFAADGDERSNTAIALTEGTLFIRTDVNVTIDGDVNGDGLADVTLDGSGNDGQRMMFLADGSGAHIEGLTFANGSSTSSSGAAIASLGDLTILNSTFTNNYTSIYGGALRIYDGTTSIANSTFDSNEASRGGAIRSSGSYAVLTVMNSTFYGNHASDDVAGRGGGAIEMVSGSTYIQHSTITGNTAFSSGGGVYIIGGTSTIVNSILVGNSEGRGGAGSYSADVSGSGSIFSNGGNVLGTSNTSGAGDIINETAGDVFEDTVVLTAGGVTVTAGELASNGGATDTVMIGAGGVAVDQGNTVDIYTETGISIDVDRDGTLSLVPIDIDQIGNNRVSGDSVDAGAVEFNSDRIVVTTTEDTRDGNLSLDDISWREALDLVADGGTITFDETLFTVDGDGLSNTVINVTGVSEQLSDRVFRIDGDLNNDGIADITFDGTGSGNELFDINGGTTSLTLDGVTVQNFYDGASGGVLRASGDLNIHSSNFIDNGSGNYGGALRLYSGSTNLITNSYFGGNAAYRDGGAIRTTGATTIIGSTFVGNLIADATSDGGAIEMNAGTLNIVNTTITGNHSADSGGGVYRTSGTLTIENSIIAGNSANGADNDVAGPFTSNGANIFGAGQGGTVAGDLVLGSGVELSDIFERTADVVVGGSGTFEAGQAANNGGTGPTVALNATNTTNAALDAVGLVSEAALGIDLNGDGDLLDTVDTDGRGFDRTVDLAGLGNTGMIFADIGAYEVQDTATQGGDFIVGNSNANTVNGLDGNDYIDGGGDNDRLFGGEGDDALRGNSANDVLRGDAGADDLFGGSGVDHALYQNSNAGVTINLATGTGSGGHAQGDTLNSIEQVTGSNGFGDRLFGNAGDNLLRGNGGDDTLRGEDGADSIVGGSGSDWSVYATSDAAVTIDLDAGTGAGGHAAGDTLSGIERVSGSVFDDRLFGDAGDNLLRGNGGDDILRGEDGADILQGGAGVDWSVYATSDAAVTVDLAAGTGTGGHAQGDTLAGIERLSGSAFNDRLFGNAADNLLRGNGGDDILRGEAGADVLIGGGGSDWSVYVTSDAAVTINLVAGAGVGGHAEGDTLAGIEKLSGSAFDDRLFGDSADNLLRGNGGDDVLRGDAGADLLFGGSGTDHALYQNSDAAVTIDLAAGTASGGHADGDTLNSIEQVTGSNGFGDRLFGNAGDNLLRGNGGDDILRGEAGSDNLVGGSGSDWSVYATSDAAVTVDLAAGTGLGGHAEGDTLSGIEKLSGSAFDDRLFGDAGDNILRGNGGDDILRGESGADAIIGGAGSDWSVYATSNAAVTVDLTTGIGVGGHAQGDSLSGIEKLSGSAFGDTLLGNAADNLLRGNGGDDTLNGRTGDDTLIGGGGNDTFVFDANWGNDTVTGFNVGGNEILDFSSIGINQGDLTISYGASDTTITFAGNQIDLVGTTATLLVDDFVF